MPLKKLSFIILIIISFGLLVVCQSKPEAPSIEDQWAISYHARSMNSPEKAERMNKTGCAHCHTAQGYWEVILEGKESTAPYEDATGLNCIACHYPGEEGAKVGKLRAGSVQDACNKCHNILLINEPDDLSWCSQGFIFHGDGGKEFPGKAYPKSAHSTVENNCASCHMAPAAEGVDARYVGGHTFRVISKDTDPRILNPTQCLNCHETISLAWVQERQEKVKALMEQLAGLLPQRPAEGEDKTEPKLPADPTLTVDQAKAAFNYWMIQRDASYGVHNPVYTKRLLEDSIEALSN